MLRHVDWIWHYGPHGCWRFSTIGPRFRNHCLLDSRVFRLWDAWEIRGWKIPELPKSLNSMKVWMGKSYKIMICVALFCHVVENQQWTKTVAARIIRWSRNTIVLPQDDMGWSWWVGLSPSGRGLCAWQPMPLSMRPQRRVNHTNQGWSCNHCCGKNHYKCGFGFVVGS